MTRTRSILLAAVLAAGFCSTPALAEKSRDSDEVFKNTQRGRSLLLPQLEERVIPHMGGADYLGPELNGGVTRMKFMRNGRVIWVDVDGRGRIIRRSRPN